MSPITDNDLAELDRWVQAEFLRMTRESLPADATSAQQERTERLAMAQASRIGFMSEFGQNIVGMTRGWARLLWVSIRPNHSEVSIDDILSGIMNRPDDLEWARAEWERLNVPVEPETKGKKKRAKKGVAGKKKATRKAAAKARRRNLAT